MNIYDKLYEKFSYSNGILEREILELGYTQDDIKDTLEDGKFEEVVYNPKEIGIDIGKVYTFVYYTDIFNSYVRSGISRDVALRYLLGSRLEYGYLTGFGSVTGISASDQYLNELTLCSIMVKESVKALNMDVTPIEKMEYTSGYYNMFKEALDNYLPAFDKSPKKPIREGIELGVITAEKLYSILENKRAKEIVSSMIQGE